MSEWNVHKKELRVDTASIDRTKVEDDKKVKKGKNKKEAKNK
jgi:hypothetical protein